MSIDLRDLRGTNRSHPGSRAAEMNSSRVGSATDPSPGLLGVPAEAVRDRSAWAKYRSRDREGRAPRHGRKTGKIRLRDQGRRGQRRGRRRDGQARGERGAGGFEASRSATPLKRWCRLYREGGADALRPKPKGRPRGSGAKAAPPTREEELEREVRRLEAQVAYLKKSIALKAELGLPLGSGPRR